MDVALKRPPVVGDEDDAKVGKKPTTIASEMSFLDRSSRPCSSNTKDWITANKEDQLESTRAEMGQVREENKRLKTILARIVKDYKSLQTHFFDVVQHEQVEKPSETSPVATQDEEEQELVSLCLGTSSRNHNNKKEEKAIPNKDKESMELDEVLTLGLDSKYERSSDNGPIERAPCLSPENISEDSKDQGAGEPWPPSKVSKNSPRIDDDEASQQTHVKKTRVSVRARCDAPTMNDGCQWRKYGQKVAKGNPCPRAYYRCTVAPACPVRKQVQRCAEDMSILITTYEGTHNHLLPISATAMVSTTSAAACMLSSGSSASHPLVTSPSSNTMNTPTLNNLSFNMSDTSRPNYQPYQSNRPTVTLDLTSPSSQFINRFSSPLFTSSTAKYPSTSTNFNFSSTNGSSSSSSYFNYGGGGTHQPCNTETQISSLNFGTQSSYMARGVTSHQRSLTDTIAKAITADPSFQSALAAAITSYVGCQGGNGGAPGYLSRSNSSGLSREQGSLVFGVQSSASMAFFSGSNSSCASTVENKRENAN